VGRSGSFVAKVIVATFTPKAKVATNFADNVADWPAGIVTVVAWPSSRANWFGLVPPMVRSERTRSLPPLFVTVTALAGVTAPRAVLNTSREVRPRTSSVEATLIVGDPAGWVMVKLEDALPVRPAPSVAVTTTVWRAAVLTVNGPL
jgi:hypothetical protein